VNKHQLAKELKQRQQKAGFVSRRQIRALSDNQIIASYITCSSCGERCLDKDNLQLAIQIAENAEQFLQTCDELFKLQHNQNN